MDALDLCHLHPYAGVMGLIAAFLFILEQWGAS